MAALRSLPFAALLAFFAFTGCASSIPKAELDRCTLGVADGNDGYRTRQGVACGLVAHELAIDEKTKEAIGYARKACLLEDAFGCSEYLSLVASQTSMQPDELSDARTAGERACSGMVFGAEGTDPRPGLCVRTAELYLKVEPKSRSDAAQLYVRACKLGDESSCARARSFGIETDTTPVATAPKASPPPPPLPRPAPPPQPVAPPVQCHEMRSCVSLELVQRNVAEVRGTLTDHCDGAVTCSVCPSRGQDIDKTACHTMNLAPNESKTGREAGLWYTGYNTMAYDCMAAGDDRSCLAQ